VAKSDGKEIAWDCSPSESWVAGEPTGGTQTQSNQVQGNEIVSETGAIHRVKDVILNVKIAA
ncbi:MAG: hypothetical protein RR242_07000, partial [Clostridium sp.]